MPINWPVMGVPSASRAGGATVQIVPSHLTRVAFSPTAMAVFSSSTVTACRSAVVCDSSTVSFRPSQRAIVPPAPTRTTLSGAEPETAKKSTAGASPVGHRSSQGTAESGTKLLGPWPQPAPSASASASAARPGPAARSPSRI